MWEHWDKTIKDDSRYYELMLEWESGMKVSLGVSINKKETDTIWKVLISTFNPGAGEYISYKGDLSTLEAAETRAWEEACKVLTTYEENDSSNRLKIGHLTRQTLDKMRARHTDSN